LIQSGPGRLLAVACRSNFGQLPTECRLSTGSPKRPDNRARWVPLARSACSQRPYNLLGFPGMMPDIANIGDKETLLSVLSRVDISVPGRSKGRKTKHTEIWMICHLLSTLAHNERLSYPVSVVHRDRPDFLVRNGNREIGVEATEGITPEFAKYSALAHRQFPNALLEPGHFRPDDPPSTDEENCKLLSQNQLTSDGWAGDAAEQEWAEHIRKIVDNKLAKLLRDDFQKYDENWLYVYDNLPLPRVDLDEAIEFLRPSLEPQWSRRPNFDSLFVECGSEIVHITKNHSERLQLHDLRK